MQPAQEDFLFSGKDTKPMRLFNCFLLILFAMSCHNKITSNNMSFNKEVPPVQNKVIVSQPKPNEDDNYNDITKIANLKCGDKSFDLSTENNNGDTSIRLVEGTNKKIIRLPDQIDVNGFSLNWVKPRKEGFEISIEYGSRFYYRKKFNFICEQKAYFLNKIKVESFDKGKPSVIKSKVSIVDPKVSVNDFLIEDFLND